MSSIMWNATGFLLLVGQFVSAQPGSPVLERVRSAQSKGNPYMAPGLFKRLGDPEPHMQRVLKRGSLLRLDKTAMHELRSDRPDLVVMDLPLDAGRTLTLELVRSEVVADDLMVTTAVPVKESYEQSGSLFYQGVVRGDSRSIAAISITGDQVMGVIDVDGVGNMILGAMDNDPQGRYAFFRSADLQQDIKMECGSDALAVPANALADQVSVMNYDANKCVRVYLECEYDMYLANGASLNRTVEYITGIYNVVKTLYDNEGIRTVISEIFVWTIPDDYPTTSGYNALEAFRLKRNTGFNGDIAHLVSMGAPSGGGVAYLNTLCNKPYAFAYSYITNSFQQFPTYSWTVQVITHEMGHTLGSPHTHNCSWDVNGDGIAGEMVDGCGPTGGYTEGSCAIGPVPTNGGTIMSYCHLLGGVGINFNNGFGPLPGNRIRGRVYNGACLTTCAGQGSTNVGSNGCTLQFPALPFTESFETGLGNWIQSANDRFDWRRNSGGTPTGNTGPTGAVHGLHYMYIEANDASSGAQAILESACLDLTALSNVHFAFAWHMFGNQMGSLSLEISENTGGSWTRLWGRSGNYGNSWVNQTISLAAYIGKVVRLRFIGTLSNGVRGDMAIDH
ncbi:MAG TPA: M12 family metallo-peptidase, partial [Phnomibacter sp.]|nr:M12 family metallo-peptidase [Phnomibacter sp.]